VEFSAYDFLAEGALTLQALPWRSAQCLYLGAEGRIVDTEATAVAVTGSIRDGVAWRVRLQTKHPAPRSSNSSAVVVSSRPLPRQTWRVVTPATDQGFEVEMAGGRRLRVECRVDESVDDISDSASMVIVSGRWVDARGSRPVKAFAADRRYRSCPLPTVDLDGDGVPEVLLVENYNDDVLFSVGPKTLRKLAVGRSGV
jgi:mRNA-degrading endonuclease toxin of MazEF toxin-antitoxin module